MQQIYPYGRFILRWQASSWRWREEKEKRAKTINPKLNEYVKFGVSSEALRLPAERQGFEPWEQLPVHRISSAARSTTPASFLVNFFRLRCKCKSFMEETKSKKKKRRHPFCECLLISLNRELFEITVV